MIKYIKLARSIWAQAVKDSTVRENPFQSVELPKKAESTKRGFTEAELVALLTYLSQTGGEWLGIVMFALYSGQRLGDIVSLQWLNIDLPGGAIRLQTKKTGRFQNIPIASPLNSFIMKLNISDDPEAYLFPEARAIQAKDHRLGSLSNKFTEILVQAGIVNRDTSHQAKGKGRGGKRQVNSLTFHSLRHSATTLLKASGVSDAIAREIIGHDSEVVSRGYTHIEFSALQKAMANMPDVTGGLK